MIRRAITFVTSLFFSSVIFADGWPAWLPETAAVPFVFTSESIGNSVGVAGVVKGFGQPQAGVLGAAVLSDKGSHILYASANNYLLSPQHRWIFGVEAYQASYQDNYYYLGDANNHDSVLSQRVLTDADEAQYRLSARYVLPMGAGQTGVMQGLLPQRDITGKHPWSSGVSSLEFRPFYQKQALSNTQGEVPDSALPDTIWGLETILDWDNRNDSRNPTQGSRTKLHLHKDFGSRERASWWKWELSQSWFHALPDWTEWATSQVLAFNVYASDVPSWNQRESVDGESAWRRPPDYAASRLGGLYRLRGYAGGRYVGRSALHYSMEYRLLPDWQPLSEWPVFGWYDVPWWQWVMFADVGRVADSFDLSTLHQAMHWSLGAAVRFQVEGIVVRTEMAWSEQDSVFRVMVNQPF
ncbi:BamA/TamA family outer membrane protein [Thaumasiovibrio subtropicus]|uniref:BamA/TamA family outer membrane protein n=1 Tax=Thaumasiovibrio subtropicus TaxID=1891207 RepID=UPI000B35B442|nr:BamA/TamA family outer membrane protein [Thaumasiovibrio subtropicus]